jgi:hypothetical protein
MRDLLPRLRWGDLFDFLIAFFLFFIVVGVAPQHWGDLGAAVTTFVEAFRP